MNNKKTYVERKKKKASRPGTNVTALRIRQDTWMEFKKHCVEKNVYITDELSDLILQFLKNKDK